MKRTTIRLLSAGLLLSAASLAQAQSQDPPRLLRIFREDMKPGKGSAHTKSEAAFAHALSKAGYPSYLAMDAMTGPSQTWFLERYETYEAIDKAIAISNSDALKSTMEMLDAQDGELRTSERGLIATYQPDLSYVPTPPLNGKARYFRIVTLRIRPGHVDDFTEARKMLNAAYTKSGNPQRRAVYSVTSGMPAGTYLIVTALDSLKALDAPPTAMKMVDAFGTAGMARYNKLLADIEVSSESALFGISPKMSNPPKEYVASDPDFWAPKPKPVAAKPAPTKPAAQ